MNENELISIIIPAYNASKYICNCITNILSISEAYLNKIEILIIENGSTDDTSDKVNYFVKKNYNIKLLHSNKGVSNARNLGIKEARGKYIMFVDSDDLIIPSSFNHIFEDIKLNLDLYLYGFIKGKKEDKNENCYKTIHKSKIDNTEELIKWLMNKPTLRCQAWAKIYKRKIMIDNDLKFKNNLKYSEDSEFVLRYTKCITSFLISEKIIYKYVITEGSAMRKQSVDRIEQYINSLNFTLNEFKNDNYLKTSLSKYILTHLNIILVHDVFVYRDNADKKADKDKFEKLINEKIFKSSLKQIKIINCLSKELGLEVFIKLKWYDLISRLCYARSKKNQIL